MCQLKSCLVLKDRVFCPDYDSHQSMLEELGIEDDYLHASKTFVRVEFTPPDNTKSLIEPLDRWTLEVDQDIVPEWWDEKVDRQRVEEAIEIWRKGHVFTEGKHIVTTEKVYAYGDAEIQVYNDATVIAHDSTTVKAYSNAKVYAFGKTTVETVSNAPVEAYAYSLPPLLQSPNHRHHPDRPYHRPPQLLPLHSAQLRKSLPKP